VFMTFDKNGEMTKRSFAKSIIRSKARFTYEQVMTVISGGAKAARVLSVSVRSSR
jgi:exoribonuclease R